MDELRAEMNLATAAVLALWLAGAAACSTTAHAVPFAGGFPTKEAAVSALLDALWQRDAERMQSLAISESDFRKSVWPALPQVRAGVAGSADYWWFDLRTRSLGSMADVLREFGGRKLTLSSIAFDGAPVDYGSFRVHPKARLGVGDPAGNIQAVRLFGSLVESPGGWKIYSYIID